VRKVTQGFGTRAENESSLRTQGPRVSAIALHRDRRGLAFWHVG